MPGTDRLLNALLWDKDVDPLEWQPHPTAFARLRAPPASTVTVVNKREFVGSRAHRRRAPRAPTTSAPTRWGSGSPRRSPPRAHAPSLTYLYDGDLDWTGHRYGVASTPVAAAAVDDRRRGRAAARGAAARRPGCSWSPTTGWSTAAGDAGSTSTSCPSCGTGVALLGGEARFRHLYCHRGAVADVAATWREVLGDRAEVLTRDEAVARGWFGPVQPAVLPRLGDVMVACHGDPASCRRTDFPYEATLVGLHGSLTPEEMLIPLLVC